MKYIKISASLLSRDYVNKGGLDLFKEVLWVIVGKRAAELWAVKVGSQKKILPLSPAQAKQVRTVPSSRLFLPNFDNL